MTGWLMAKHSPQRNLLNMAIPDGQTRQDRAQKPFPCCLSPVPSPLSPSQYKELQEVCRGFMLFLIHTVDVVLQQKRGMVVALLGNSPRRCWGQG